MPKKSPTPRPSQVFARQMRATRLDKRWSQQDLADRLSDLGVSKDRASLAKLENGTGVRGVLLDDALVIAAALDVSPVHLFVPTEDGGAVAVAPNLAGDAQTVRNWVGGQEPLPGQDPEFFHEHASEDEKRSTPGWSRWFHLYGLVNEVADTWAGDDLEQREEAAKALEREAARLRDEVEAEKRKERRHATH